MRKIYRSLFITLFSVMFLSCEGDILDPSALTKSITINASIDEDKGSTSNGEWESGDKIGVYMIKSTQLLSGTSILHNNEKFYTQGDGNFSPSNDANDIRFPESGAKVDFIAYYPYSATISNKFEYIIDVTNQKDQSAIDLLYSDNATNKSVLTPDVDMLFTHQLSKITISISTLDNSPLENVRASIKGIDLKGKFSLVDKTITSSSKGNIRLSTSDKGDKAEAIVIPTQSLSGVAIEIVNGSYAYECKLDNLSTIDSFKPGITYAFDIKLDPENTVVSVVVNPSSSIKPWEELPPENVIIGKGDEIEDGDGTGDIGSEYNPYTIEEAKNSTGEKQVWVKGYIVGYYKGNTVKTFSTDISSDVTIKETSIALAASPDETNGENTYPVFLKSGSLRDALNLNDNRDNIGKEVKIRGNIDKYYGTIGFKTTQEYKFID